MAAVYLTPEEVNELRILRRVSQSYEFYTDLDRDLKKGFDTNIFNAALADSNQLNCANEAESSRQFLQTLHRRRLLKYFEIDSSSDAKLDRPYLLGIETHTGLQIRNKRTKEILIVDRWFEAGGQPSHILTKNEWMQKNDENDIVQVANLPLNDQLK